MNGIILVEFRERKMKKINSQRKKKKSLTGNCGGGVIGGGKVMCLH